MAAVHVRLGRPERISTHDQLPSLELEPADTRTLIELNILGSDPIEPHDVDRVRYRTGLAVVVVALLDILFPGEMGFVVVVEHLVGTVLDAQTVNDHLDPIAEHLTYLPDAAKVAGDVLVDHDPVEAQIAIVFRLVWRVDLADGRGLDREGIPQVRNDAHQGGRAHGEVPDAHAPQSRKEGLRTTKSTARQLAIAYA